MANGTRKRKIQTGLHLTVSVQNLLRNISDITGKTMSQIAQEAIQEYAFHHREELKFLDNLTVGGRTSF